MAPSIQSICPLLTIEKYASKKVLLAGSYTMNKTITSIMQPHSLFEAIQCKNWVSLTCSFAEPTSTPSATSVRFSHLRRSTYHPHPIQHIYLQAIKPLSCFLLPVRSQHQHLNLYCTYKNASHFKTCFSLQVC